MISSRELSLRGKTADTSTAPGARGRFRRDHRRLRAENKNFLKNVLSNIPVQNPSVYQLVNIFEDIFPFRLGCELRMRKKFACYNASACCVSPPPANPMAKPWSRP